jgi:hypothetical protein
MRIGPARLLALAPLLAAAAATTPPPGSPLRKALLDGLRPTVEAKIGPNVEFTVSTMQAAGGWAFVQAEPRRKGGKPIDGAAYFGEAWENMDGLTVTAAMRLEGGRWRVAEYAIGATDAWYCAVPAIGKLLNCR